MTIMVLAAALVIVAPLALAEDGGAGETPRKGDRLSVRGCVNGPLLEAIEPSDGQTTPDLPPGLTFRLTGDKKLLKKIRSEENGRKVEIDGVLKSDLSHDLPLGTKVGKTRIVVGVGTQDQMQRQTPPHRPVIEVKSYEPLAVTCGG
jgi:hypothetical protein